MKIKCLQNVCASGSALEAGKTYDISDSDYTLLKSMGKVMDVPVETKSKKTAKRKVNGTN